jgi:hypothetical protein
MDVCRRHCGSKYQRTAFSTFLLDRGRSPTGLSATPDRPSASGEADTRLAVNAVARSGNAYEFASSSVGRGLNIEDQSPWEVTVNTYRIYFFGDRAICGRHDFDAANDATAFQIAQALFDACSDSCQSFHLWQGERRLYVLRTYRETSFAEMSQQTNRRLSRRRRRSRKVDGASRRAAVCLGASKPRRALLHRTDVC